MSFSCSLELALYEARLKAVQTVVDIYKTDTQAYTARISAEAQKVEAYKAQVGAYSALVSAKSEEYKGYATQVGAELAKVQLYQSQVEAYRAEVAAFSALTEANQTARFAGVPGRLIQGRSALTGSGEAIELISKCMNSASLGKRLF